MLDHVLYLLFGFMDVFALLVVALALFRIPILKKVPVIAFISTLASLLSYLNRMVMNWSVFDLLSQFVLSVLFFVILFKFRLFWSMIVVSSGMIVFLPLQFTIYVLLTRFDFLPAAISGANTGFVFVLQLLTDATCLLIAWIIRLSKGGYRFMPQTPHDFKEKIPYFSPQYEKLTLALAANLINLLFSLFLTLNGWIYFSYAISMVVLITMLILFRQTDNKSSTRGSHVAGKMVDLDRR
ncbi:hypothetical protein HGI30_02745 [Paenibacillus albicereus]|uniref:Uncharacterized protein n=1 Tax=Paenibacillus albicereus TaxID=2726185 RepID=A0A6H2GT61_9BACL|nr:hypothetical protein [Paenibacillus albicereus]QJC50614.1 hypothetical protein HGI30_02745 [Paenibacillus albicereus]